MLQLCLKDDAGLATEQHHMLTDSSYPELIADEIQDQARREKDPQHSLRDTKYNL